MKSRSMLVVLIVRRANKITTDVLVSIPCRLCSSYCSSSLQIEQNVTILGHCKKKEENNF